MEKKTRVDAKDFAALKELGFELEAPQDEFSYQPGSGSTASGRVAKDEYGIDVEPEVEIRSAGGTSEDGEREDPTEEVPGESLWSLSHRIPEEEDYAFVSESDPNGAEIPSDDLETIIRHRIAHHPDLRSFEIDLSGRGGVITVSGSVPGDAAKLRVSELIQAIPGVMEIHNLLKVDGESAEIENASSYRA